jgi:hypothetical protein
VWFPLDLVVIMTVEQPAGIVETPCDHGTGFRTVHRVTSTPPDVPGDSKDWTGARAPVPRVRLRPGHRRSPRDPGDGAGERGDVAAGAGLPRRRRPARQGVWSPLEYACHVRDVYRVFDARLHLMLDENDPQLSNWDQDETAVADRYWEQDPAVVSAELAAVGETVASSFAAVGDGEWSRRGRRSDGAVFTVESFGRYFFHDWVHHAWDVTAG